MNYIKSSYYSHLPVMLICAPHDLDKSLILDGGPDDYLEKPFDIDILISKIAKYLKMA